MIDILGIPIGERTARHVFLTELRALEKEEGIGGSREAFFWIMRARSAILRSVDDAASGPKETVWNDRGIL